MKLTDKQKEAIRTEYDSFVEQQYAGKTLAERQKLGQFFTPAEITIKMIEQYESFDKNDTILDPTMGAGGLLAAVLVAELVKPENCYGIEIDPTIFNTAKNRLIKLGVNKKYFTDTSKFTKPNEEKNCRYENHFYLGDALKDDSYDFPEHKETFKISNDCVNLFNL